MTTIVFQLGVCSALLGCLAALGWLCWTLADESSLLGAVIAALIGLPLIGGAGYALFAAIADRDSPILATLRKGDWACVSAHSEVVTTFVSTGKTMIPVVTSEKVCDTYARTGSGTNA